MKATRKRRTKTKNALKSIFHDEDPEEIEKPALIPDEVRTFGIEVKDHYPEVYEDWANQRAVDHYNVKMPKFPRQNRYEAKNSKEAMNNVRRRLAQELKVLSEAVMQDKTDFDFGHLSEAQDSRETSVALHTEVLGHYVHASISIHYSRCRALKERR